MKDSIKPNSPADYFGALFLIAVFFVGMIIFWQVVVIPNKEVTSLIISTPTCLGSEAEYRELIEKGQSVLLSQNQWSHASTGRFVGDKRVIARRGGEIACGYLYVEAHKGSSPLDEKYDSIYVNPQGLGGHIVRSRSLEVSGVETKTQVLLPLDSISYLPKVPYDSESQDFEIADWVKLLNASPKIEFWIALSALSPNSVIDEVRIAYKCWDPSTGKEATDCQLSIED